jgi:hypothetical protein
MIITKKTLVGVAAGLAIAACAVVPASAQDHLKDLEKPKPAVPEMFTITGEFVRIAYNNEGFCTLGYRVANDSAGDKWLLLEMGATVQKGVKNYTLKREDLSVQMPNGATIGLATQKEFTEANRLPALNKRATQVRDSINYFPVSANRACTMNFFADPSTPGRSLAYDQVELSSERACLGRIYFQVPDGIETGQYYLNVKFASSVVQVPFRIFTKEEQKQFNKEWKTLKKEHDAEYKQ